MTNLEYINSLPCSQRLKDRIIELTKESNFKWGVDNDRYFNYEPNVSLTSFFNWNETEEGHKYWELISQAIFNNTPIVE